MKNSIKSQSNDKALNNTNIKLANSSNAVITKKKLPRVYLYFIYFIVFAFIGWLIETAFSYYSLGHFTKRGFCMAHFAQYTAGVLLYLLCFLALIRKKFKTFCVLSYYFYTI